MKTKRLLLSLAAMVCVISIFGALVSAGQYTYTINYSLKNSNPLIGKSSANTKFTSVTGQYGVERTFTTKAWIKNKDDSWATNSDTLKTKKKSDFGGDTASNGSATATSDSSSKKTSWHYYNMSDDEYNTGGSVTYYSATSTSGKQNVG